MSYNAPFNHKKPDYTLLDTESGRFQKKSDSYKYFVTCQPF